MHSSSELESFLHHTATESHKSPEVSYFLASTVLC